MKARTAECGLKRSDGIINLRNQEIAALNSRLAVKDETIAEAAEQIDRLKSQLEQRSPNQPETSATVGTDLSEIEPADLLNQLKARRKKSRADLADMQTLLDILSNLGSRIK
ncbi:flagellar alpha dynein [Microcoleus sp. F10-C6]|uniref:flagellar alpha dynein n=1 Tax=unclassified Microcoleus TaxID=2642155 RepID=UPI002FCF756A